MQIKIIGVDDGTAEYHAATNLYDILNMELINIIGNIFIKPNLKVTGTNKQQLDLVVWGEFDGGYLTPYNLIVYPKDPKNDFNPIDNPIERRVNFKNIFLVIEVKGHTYSGIRTKGNELEVIYKDGGTALWHNASEQSQSQVYTVKKGIEDFFKRKNEIEVKCPFVLNLIWLTSINIAQVKSLNIPNALPANFDAKLLLQTIALCQPPVKIDKPILDFIRSNTDEKLLTKLLIDFFNYFD